MKRVDITSIFYDTKGQHRKGAANQPYALFAIKYATARFFVLCRAVFAARKTGQLNIRELGVGRCAIQFWSCIHLLHVKIIAHHADGLDPRTAVSAKSPAYIHRPGLSYPCVRPFSQDEPLCFRHNSYLHNFNFIRSCDLDFTVQKNESHMLFPPIQFQRQRQSSNGQRNYNDFQNINRQNRSKCHGKEVHGKVDRVGERCDAALAC